MDTNINIKNRIKTLLDIKTNEIVIDKLTPESLLNAQESLLSDSNLVLLIQSSDYIGFLDNKAFANWFDPATRYEMFHKGDAGNLLGMTIITDHYIQTPILKHNSLLSIPNGCDPY